jgi:oligopeptide/dipeptide ABC transporter ATP-binding protein
VGLLRRDGPLLEVRDLTVDLPGPGGLIRVLHGLSLAVGPGEILGVVGESGSGKSVAALSILRLLPPGAIVGGDIRLAGTDVMGLSRSGLRSMRSGEVRIIFQDPMAAFDPLVPLGRQLRRSQPGGARRNGDGEIIDLLTSLQLPDPSALLRARPHQLSGGQLQRVAIASALLGSPSLLICDEPTTALDATTEVEILEILSGLREERGMSIIITSHDISVISSMADRVMVMYAGEQVEVGPAGQVIGAPAHPYASVLIAARPDPAASRGQRLARISGRAPEAGRRPGGCPFHPRCPRAEARCRTDAPVPVTVDPDHVVTCWAPGRAAAPAAEAARA